MKNSKLLNLIGQLLLLTATLAWGTSFFILKETIAKVNEMFVISVRFLISAGLLFIIFFKRITKVSKKTIFHGFILGLILVSAYIVQTRGLQFTTSSRNAFLTSSYCVMTPFLAWLIVKSKPTIKNVVCAVVCIVGIGFVSLSNQEGTGSNVLLGDFLTIIAAVFFALQIIFIDKYQKQKDDFSALLFMELLTVGVICGIGSLIFELPNGTAGYILNSEQIFKILYLTIACTLVAQLCQMYGQKLTTSNQASLILSLEAVFGALFSVLLGNEVLSTGLIIGFVIIFIAMVLNELNFKKPELLKKE